jgi:hypothetical protein
VGKEASVLWSLPGTITPVDGGKFTLSARLTGEDWNKEIVAEAPKYDHLRLPDKLSYLERRYGFVRPELTAHILSLNAARNCLTHRAGVVGTKDVKDPTENGLTVRWRRLRGEIVEPSGARKPVTLGAFVEAGSQIEVGFEEVSKSFLLGSRVEFTSTEFADICLTFSIFAIAVEQAISASQNRRIAAEATTAEKTERVK